MNIAAVIVWIFIYGLIAYCNFSQILAAAKNLMCFKFVAFRIERQKIVFRRIKINALSLDVI